MNKFSILTLAAILACSTAFGLTYPLPESGNDVVGQVKIVQSKPKDTLFTIARRYEMGFDEIKEANKNLPTWGYLKKNTAVIIPSEFILPNSPRAGVVINLPEKRLYLYPNNESVVITEPVAIGIYGWPTPLLDGRLIEKAKDPTWNIPESIQIERELEGKPPITFIGPGPDNPLGKYAIRTSNRSILMHSTNALTSIGRRASHGCIRMYPEDAEEMFYSVELQMPIRIINQPFKAGWNDHKLYFETQPTLVETRGSVDERVQEAFDTIMRVANYDKNLVNWTTVEKALVKQDGIPVRISK